MRLVGYSFVARAGPVESGHLTLGDLSVVVGPNDAGKSRLLASLARALRGDRKAGEGSAFFLEVPPPEAEAVFAHLLARHPRAIDPDNVTEEDVRKDPRLRDYDDLVLEPGPAREAWLAAIDRLAKDENPFSELIDPLLSPTGDRPATCNFSCRWATDACDGPPAPYARMRMSW